VDSIDSHPLWVQFKTDLEACRELGDLSVVRDRYLSRQRGLLSLELRRLGSVPAERRPAVGQTLNELKEAMVQALERRLQELKAAEEERRFEAERIDVSLPGYFPPRGSPHPIARLWAEMADIFVRMGFEVLTGPEVETDYYNFEALNIPADHPARDDQDTFYLSENVLLRTHTSPGQIRTMEKRRPPVRIAVPGRVFRRDAADATHSPMFHQVEGLVVDRNISLADLKGSLRTFFRELFHADIRVRLRPSYFPFVEPGAEVDISCVFCGGEGCRVCKRSGWVEVLGAGMVHPRVFQMVGYDPEEVTGYAWGMGIDRIALFKYQIDDIRLLFENDLRFLRQF